MNTLLPLLIIAITSCIYAQTTTSSLGTVFYPTIDCSGQAYATSYTVGQNRLENLCAASQGGSYLKYTCNPNGILLTANCSSDATCTTCSTGAALCLASPNGVGTASYICGPVNASSISFGSNPVVVQTTTSVNNSCTQNITTIALSFPVCSSLSNANGNTSFITSCIAGVPTTTTCSGSLNCSSGCVNTPLPTTCTPEPRGLSSTIAVCENQPSTTTTTTTTTGTSTGSATTTTGTSTGAATTTTGTSTGAATTTTGTSATTTTGTSTGAATTTTTTTGTSTSATTASTTASATTAAASTTRGVVTTSSSSILMVSFASLFALLFL